MRAIAFRRQLLYPARACCLRSSLYREDNMTPSRYAAAAAGTLLIALLGSPSIADVISDWGKAVAPPVPELKEATVDPAPTPLLFLDMMKAGCSPPPPCIAAVPNLKLL